MSKSLRSRPNSAPFVVSKEISGKAPIASSGNDGIARPNGTDDDEEATGGAGSGTDGG
jgi:hypothetical protein